jgi:hypothetical protein
MLASADPALDRMATSGFAPVYGHIQSPAYFVARGADSNPLHLAAHRFIETENQSFDARARAHALQFTSWARSLRNLLDNPGRLRTQQHPSYFSPQLFATRCST